MPTSARLLGLILAAALLAPTRLPQLMDTRKGIYGRDRQVWRGFAELVMIRTRVSTPWAAGEGAASGEFRRG
jgi:hypothetical protein